MFSKEFYDVMVVDIDEVIVDIKPPWLAKLRVLPESSQLKSKLKLEQADDVIINSHSRLQEAVICPTAEKHHREEFNNVYASDSDFYASLTVTKFAETLSDMLDSNRIGKLVFLSNTLAIFVKAKEELIYRTFNDKSKIEFAHNTSRELSFRPKSEVIKESIGKFDVFIDDSEYNIKDVAENTDCEGALFLMPAFDFNKVVYSELESIVAANGATLSMYDV